MSTFFIWYFVGLLAFRILVSFEQFEKWSLKRKLMISILWPIMLPFILWGMLLGVIFRNQGGDDGTPA